jgi:tetratricopeptide (TPR) repeat protein
MSVNARIVLAVLLFTTIPVLSVAGTRTISKTVRYVMGENESRQVAREQALRDAKRQTLEETGVFLEAATTLRERTKEGTGHYTNDSEFASDVQQVTAGVTMSEVLKEEWRTEGNVVVLYLTCKVTVDPQDVSARINRVLESRKRLGDTSRVENDVDQLKAEIEDLKKRTPTMPVNKADKAPLETASVAPVSAPLISARALYERGLYTEALQSATDLIDRNTDNADARILRGQIYAQMKGRYAMAVRDLETAIRLQPHSVQARIVLADIHYRIGGNKTEAKRLIEDTLLLAPGNQDALRILRTIEQ